MNEEHRFIASSCEGAMFCFSEGGVVTESLPVITYVTDPDLSLDEQRRVISRFVDCAALCPVRVAFRLPEVVDAEVVQLVDWFGAEYGPAERTGLLLPAWIHNRPSLIARYPDAGHWYPAAAIPPRGDYRQVRSIHSRKELDNAIQHGASDVVFGHVFTTQSHPGQEPRGLDALGGICSAARNISDRIALTAIGGITPENAHQVAELGVRSIAVMRSISRAMNIAETIRSFRNCWMDTEPGK